MAMVPFVPGDGGFSAVIFMRQKFVHRVQEKLRARGANFAHVTEADFDKLAEAQWDEWVLERHTTTGASYQVMVPLHWGLVAESGLRLRFIKLSRSVSSQDFVSPMEALDSRCQTV